MQKDLEDVKKIVETNHTMTGKNNESPKRSWQTPEIIEEDYRETESGNGFSDDGVLYS